MLDLLIKNGQYPDFSEGRMKQGNIGITDGKITYIGPEEPDTKEGLDARGKVVSPGFIDIHMHEEHFAEEGEHYVIAQMMLEMGVTTAVGGNCGMQNQNLSYFKEVLDRLGGSPVNYIMLAGYNTFRYELGIGRYETASQEQRETIRNLLQRELNEGAYGISFGIEYDPGITTEEILYAIGVTEDPNLLVSAHYREDCLQHINPVQEMIEIAEKIPMKFQISHLSSCSAMGLMQESLDAINEAMKRNPKLNYDTYPYNAFSTHMGSAVFEDGCIEGWHKDYSDILLTDAPYKDIRCTKEIFEKVREEYPDMLAVAFVMNEEEIAAAIANPNGMVASDAIINNGNGHPRAAGTFPRVLGKYVREDKALPLIDAIRKMTLEPAKRMDLDQKGRIELGCDADLTIFNPDTIIDGATFSNLHIQPEGIEAVFIDGKLALKNKVTINNRLGKYIAYR
ncbi:MAG: amidohydrolase family protein [Emergencia timonensis]|uniref:amidohydrolase family protein n=1 Tax=Emergencia timonensis TaxID=1776384 RepID=UPI00082E6D6F|nr:amidohydrolase family protein [Emergencia timonensis]WNX86787.1 amidohydrolase family protein [Emergencia timonensis]